MAQRIYILQICYDPDEDEVEWMTEEIREEEPNIKGIKLLDPFDVLDIGELTREEIEILNSSEIGIS
jgi:hypothetical protein